MVPRVQLIITTLCLTAIQPVFAQGLDAGPMQSMTPSSAIGPEQDSLLPPEVVPLDPNSASQVQSRQQANAGGYSAAQASSAQQNNVPGLSAPATSAKDMRNQAFSQLYGNQTSIPAAAMKPWRANQQALNSQATGQQAMGQQGMFTAPSQVPGLAPIQGQAVAPGQMSASMPPISGLPPGMMPQGNMSSAYGMAPQSQLGGPNYQMANNQTTNGQSNYSQSQTLTGGSQNQPTQQNTHRGGFSNAFSAFSTMGLGVIANPLMSGLMMAGPFTRF